jgi:putative endonuclease
MNVLYRNFKASGGGEVDIVCRDGDCLVFIEVKTRSSERFGRPADAVDEQKRRLIARGALGWLRLLGFPEVLLRFDVVEVLVPEAGAPTVNRIENCFQLPEGSYP